MKKKLSKEEILKLAKKKGIKLSFLNSLIGGYRGRLTDWKNGKTSLTESETEIIVNYLLGTDNASVDEKNTLSSDENNLIELFRSVDDFGREAIKNTASHEQKRCLSERSLSRMNKNDRYNAIQEKDDEMRNYASKILKSVDETYNEVFYEHHDIDKLKYFINIDSAIIDEAHGFYKNDDDLMRSETDSFFEACYKFIRSVEDVIKAKGRNAISERKQECGICFEELVNSVKDTILEDREVLNDLTTNMERSEYVSRRKEEDKKKSAIAPTSLAITSEQGSSKAAARRTSSDNSAKEPPSADILIEVTEGDGL